jgi:hypothetical protein
VAAMKLTPNAAMRARDVSRPHAEHFAQAEAASAEGPRARTPGRGRGEGSPGGAGTNGAVADAARGPQAEASAGDHPARPGFPRRRRGPRTGQGRTGR